MQCSSEMFRAELPVGAVLASDVLPLNVEPDCNDRFRPKPRRSGLPILKRTGFSGGGFI